MRLAEPRPEHISGRMRATSIGIRWGRLTRKLRESVWQPAIRFGDHVARRRADRVGGNRPGFDPDRFDELVLYIAHQVKDRPDFGRIKLAKVLFYSDFTAYRETGSSLTGATYLRYPKGPFPRGLYEAEARLERAERVRLDHEVEDYEEKRIVALRPADRIGEMYEDWQLDFVRQMIEEIGSMTANKASDRSHEHAGWIVVEENAEIPYGSTFVPDEAPTGLDAQR